MESNKTRCTWVDERHQIYIDYHDQEWGIPLHHDVKLFEALVLDGAQAGLSWLTILKRRVGYRKAFDNFDFHKVARYDDSKVQELLNDVGIIRNRLKIKSAINNAKVFIEIRKEFGSFDSYIWKYVDNKPIVNHYTTENELPSKTALSDAISKDLKDRGMSFVGSTIIYAMMQAIGMVNDHTVGCFCREES